MRRLTILWRSLRLRCPHCGQGKLFRGWFAMYPRCEACGMPIEREPGFFLGSIYFNYGVTALVVTVAYFTLHFGTDVPENLLVGSLGVFCVAFPVWFHRYARSLWMGFDEWLDPWSDANGGKPKPRSPP